VVLVAYLIWFGYQIRNFGNTFDLGKQPPEQTFRRVFDLHPPAEVRAWKVAGATGGQSGNVWMRLEVDDVERVLTALKQNPHFPLSAPTKCSKPVIRGDLSGYYGGDSEWTKEYERAVVWESVYHIKRPEYYTIGKPYAYTFWAGVLVVDRQHRRMFVYAALY
jgi:hypothetical protein